MRKKIVAGNWKMNKTLLEAEELLAGIDEGLGKRKLKKTGVIVCPPYVYLELAVEFAVEGRFAVGAQNISDQDSGAYTGEISSSMLRSVGVNYAIIGHSERRKYYQESHEFLEGKVNAALRGKINPIFCCGETLPERENKKHFSVVKKQLDDSLFSLSDRDFKKIIIAYEPVWAIGTGVNATPAQAQQMHAHIRKLIAKRYDEKIANSTTILYGGSCNSKNAAELFSQPDVDGGLIGGASLQAEEFLMIIDAASR
jgi:triosephosphate isomerase (TIM)